MLKRTRLISVYFAIAFLLVFSFNAFAQTSSDNFERTDGAPGANWSVHPDLAILNGNLHNSNASQDWLLGIYSGAGTVVNPTEATLEWAGLGDGCDDNGVQWGGVAFLNSFSALADGYMVQVRLASPNNIRLWLITDGELDVASGIVAQATVSGSVPSPGSDYKVVLNPATHTFQVYTDNELMGTVQDAGATYNLDTRYGGILLASSKINDVESFSVGITAPDGTPPATINDLNASTSGSSTVLLEWTASGDDGTTGTAVLYDVRYSTSNINNDTDFNNANTANGEPTPQTFGTAESFLVTGLDPETEYYFSLKVKDDADNWSGMSNVVSAITEENSIDPGTFITVTDDFERATLGTGWAATVNHEIRNGTLGIIDGTSANWNNLAVYQGNRAVSPAGMAVMLDLNECDAQGAVALGLAVLLDSPSSFASGFFVLRRPSSLQLWSMTNGAVGAEIMRDSNPDQNDPQPGDVIKVLVSFDEDLGQVLLDVYINDQLDGQLVISGSEPSTWYAGIIQHGSFNNNIDSFTIYADGGTAEMISEYYGNGQTGPIQSTLPDSIAVQVTDAFSNPTPGVVVDFELVNGTATLSVDSYDWGGLIWSEVEDGTIISPAVTQSDASASGGIYVMTPNDIQYSRQGGSILSIYVPESGSFDFWLRVIAPDGLSNSMFYRIDEGDTLEVKWTSTWTAWQWRKINTFYLEKGFHQIYILTREEGTQFDKILLADNASQAGYLPSGVGGTGPNLPNITDSNGIAYSFVTFSSNADDDVVVEAAAYKENGIDPLMGSPVTFTLDPQPGNATTITRDQSQANPMLGVPLQQMATPMRAFVRDNYGNGVSGVNVSWEITEGNGTLSQVQTTSDALGVVENYLTLSAQNSPYVIEASAGGLVGSPVTFNVEPGDPPTIIKRINPAADINGSAGEELPELFTVRVEAEDGSPFAGFPVLFIITDGDGDISTEAGSEHASQLTVPTDVDGYASVRWVLGDLPGANQLESRGDGLTDTPIVFNATGQVGQPAILSMVSGNNQSGPLGLPLQYPYVVKLTDQAGNGVANQNVEFRITQGTAAHFGTPGITVRTIQTNSAGMAQDTLVIGNVVGQEHFVQVSVPGYPAITALNFSATSSEAIASELSYVSGNGVKVGNQWQYQSATVNTQLAQDFIVRVNGPFGNDPIAGHPVVFRVISGNGRISGSTEVTVNTGGDGVATARLTLGSQAGDSVHVVQAIAYRTDYPSQTLNNAPITFKANGTPATANQLVKIDSVENQVGIVGQPLAKKIQAKITDLFGNAIEGHTVTFEVQNFGGSLQGTTGEPGQVKQVLTNDDGIASIIWIMPTIPGQVQLEVRATSDGVNSLNGSPITYSAFPGVDVAYEMQRVTGVDLAGVVAQALPGNLIVKVLDQYGNPVSTYPVTFTVVDGNGLVNGNNQVTVQSGADGTAQVEWVLGNEKGFENNTVEATASLSVNNKITFKASGLSDVAFRMIPDSTFDSYGVVGELLDSPVKVQIVDQFGNPVSGHFVTFEVDEVNGNTGYINTPGTVTKVDTTDDDGIAQINWGLGPKPGSQNNKLTVISKRNNIHLINSPYDEFIASALAGSAYKVVKITNDTTQSLSSVHGSTLPEYLKVKVVDQFGNPIGRHPVKFQVLSRQVANGGTLDGMVDSVKTKETDSNGIASVQFTLGLNAGNNINKVQYVVEQNGQPLVGSPGLFEITGLSSTATQIVKVSGDNQNTGTVGEYWQLPLKVAAKDKNGNNVVGQPVTFKIEPKGDLEGAELGALGPGTATDTTVNTDSEGIASIMWKSGYEVGQYQVKVTSFALSELQGSPMTFTGTAFAQVTDVDQSTITVAPDTLSVSAGGAKATITVTLKDRYGNPVQNKGVTIQASGEGNTIQQPTSASNANGQVTGYIYSSASGVKSISARDINNEIDILNKAQVYFQASEASRVVKIDATDRQTRNVGTVLAMPFQVMVVDQFDNPIPDFPVLFNVTQNRTGGQMVEGNTTATNEEGIASKLYRLGTTVGTNLIEATAQGVSGSTAVFSVDGVNPVDLKKPVIISGDSLHVAPGQPLPEDLIVQVQDERGWPVYNKKVDFEALSTNDGLITSSNPHMTDWYGYARGKAQVGTKVGINLFNATLTDFPEKGSVTFYAWTTSASTAKYLTFVSGPGSGTVGQTLGQPVIMKTTDDYGNPVQGINVTFVVINDASVDGAGTFSGGLTSVTKTTNSQGQVSVFYTLSTVSGVNKIRANALNLDPSSYEVIINANPDSPYSMAKWSGDQQHGEMGKHLFDPIYVRVYDRHGNPSPGGVVTFTVTQGDGYVDGNESTQSDENGLARAYWVLGPRPYATTNTIQVTSTYLQVQGGGSITFTAYGDDQNYPEFQNLPENLEVFETSAINLQISATDGDGDNVYYTAQNLPAGATFEASSSTEYYFRWTPDLNVVSGPEDSRTFYPVFIAQDDHEPSGRVKDSVKVVVKNYNRPPEITSYTPPVNIIQFDGSEVDKIDFSVQTNDLDGDPLTVTWYVGDTQVAEGNSFTLMTENYPLDQNYTVKVKVSDYFNDTEVVWTMSPTMVELNSFSALAEPFKGVTIEWETARENSNAGFNLLRSNTEVGPFTKVNEKMIPPSKEKSYTFHDANVKSGKTYFYMLEDISFSGARNNHGPIQVESPLPTEFTLSQNYPNPFNPVTTIRYELPKHSHVTIQVYNIMGQMVRQLVDSQIEAGYHTILWDGTNATGMRVGSGVYYYRIIAGDYTQVKKMVLLK